MNPIIRSISHFIPGIIRYPIHRWLHRVEKIVVKLMDKEYLLMTYWPRKYADMLFYRQFGYYIDWKNPRDLNEKINYLEFKTNTKEWSRLADKYLVREFVKKRGCEELLIPLYAVWDKIEDIDYTILPNRFVLKTNCSCGDAIIVVDNNTIDRCSVANRINDTLKCRFGKESAEPHYLRIQPKIIAEKLLESNNKDSLVDYKIWCFHGRPFCIFTCSNRDLSTHRVDFNVFDLKWERMDHVISERYRNSVYVPKPVNLEQVLQYARILSNGFPEVRVDFYEVDGIIYFGEMTFTSACGRMDYFTPEFLKIMGDQVRI